jgi:short-subunit dehydrogenase
MFKYKGVIITDASFGIGKALADELSKRGTLVVLAELDSENLFETKLLSEQNIKVAAVVKNRC